MNEKLLKFSTKCFLNQVFILTWDDNILPAKKVTSKFNIQNFKKFLRPTPNKQGLTLQCLPRTHSQRQGGASFSYTALYTPNAKKNFT